MCNLSLMLLAIFDTFPMLLAIFMFFLPASCHFYILSRMLLAIFMFSPPCFLPFLCSFSHASCHFYVLSRMLLAIFMFFPSSCLYPLNWDSVRGVRHSSPPVRLVPVMSESRPQPISFYVKRTEVDWFCGQYWLMTGTSLIALSRNHPYTITRTS